MFGNPKELSEILKDIDVSELKREVCDMLGLSEVESRDEKEESIDIPENIQKMFN